MDEDKKKIGEMKKERDKPLSFLGINRDDPDQMGKKCSGKILGLDYGSKNIGLAMSDREQNQAFVYDTLKVTKKLFDQIKEICDKEEIDKIVVGLPLSMKGEYTEKTNEVIFFIEELEERVKVIVVTEDERLSSVEAKKRNDGPASRRRATASRGKQGIDEASAQIILEQYLNKLKN